MLSVYGSIKVLEREAIFETILQELKAAIQDKQGLIGLSGGSSPKALYTWLLHHKLEAQLAQKAFWGVSDERMVPLESEESNFGNAQRLLLDPLEVPKSHYLPIATTLEPAAAAAQFNDLWKEHFPQKHGFDLCILGMGEDAHIASIFPHSPLLDERDGELFSSVYVPDKGWRLSITPQGLLGCGSIIVMVCGASKAAALRSVFEDEADPKHRPAQLLKACAPFTTWLVDTQAASELKL
jgi:6-phosphogluconolactonase